jgi:hypothetical protein
MGLMKASIRIVPTASKKLWLLCSDVWIEERPLTLMPGYPPVMALDGWEW